VQPGFTGAPIAAPFSFGHISIPNQDPSCDGQNITIATSRLWAILPGDLTHFLFPAELTMTGSEFQFQKVRTLLMPWRYVQSLIPYRQYGQPFASCWTTLLGFH
jgi:hypothetical protein